MIHDKAKQKNSAVSTVILVAVFFVGLSVLLYPSVSSWWNARLQARAVASYNEAVDAIEDEDYTAYFEAAEAYNEALAQLGSAALLVADQLEDYEDILDVTGTGVMGYITIEKLDLELPIYHGTDDSILRSGAGHLEGSSLPVGGESTHCVISAHRGLPSATLFTNLDKLETGDTFTITVLNQVLTYEVDQISIVLPEELENLYIEDGADYCTLMTCTPYGINTHRLLVRGRRIESETPQIRVSAEANKIDPAIVAPIVAVPMLMILLVGLLLNTYRKKKEQKEDSK